MIDDTGKMTAAEERTPGWVIPAVIVVAILAVVGIGVGWKGFSYAQTSHDALNGDIQTLKQGYTKDIESLQERLTQNEKTNADLMGDLNAVTRHLQITQAELKKARQEAQVEAEQVRDDATKQIADMGTDVNGQLATKASNDDVKAVGGEVTGVRTDLDSTKNDLKMARSELGTLIAKNHDDIETLRTLGERDYLEFNVAAKNAPQKVGDVTIELKGTDPKKNQCNLAIVVDDKRTEKRARTINEPIFLYAHGSRRPMEIVINEVGKNKIAGYLSVPKPVPPNASLSGN
jgi:vacuolar-type H+-ATPase subunit H